MLLLLLLLVLALAATGYGGYSYARSQYYVGAHAGEVVIFRGLSQQVAGRDLSRVRTRTGLALRELPKLERNAVVNSIPADSQARAEEIVSRLRAAARPCATGTYPGGVPPEADRRFPERPTGSDRTTRTQPGSTPPGSAQPAPSASTRPSPEVCPEGVNSTGG